MALFSLAQVYSRVLGFLILGDLLGVFLFVSFCFTDGEFLIFESCDLKVEDFMVIVYVLC